MFQITSTDLDILLI